MKARPIIPTYQMVAIALVILAGIVVTMLQEGTFLRKLIDGTCIGDCVAPSSKPMGTGVGILPR